jgi:hypothetical protein
MERSDRLRAGGHSYLMYNSNFDVRHITSPQAAAQQSESAPMDGTYACRNCHIYFTTKKSLLDMSHSAVVAVISMSAVVVARSPSDSPVK